MIRDDGKYSYATHKWTLSCLQCGQPFEATRQDAKYCSATCRKAAARRKDQINRAANIAISQISNIRRIVEKWSDLEIAGAVELERINRALLTVTPAGRTDTRVGVTVAVGTDKACRHCGQITFVSPASGLCLKCIQNGDAAKIAP